MHRIRRQTFIIHVTELVMKHSSFMWHDSSRYVTYLRPRYIYVPCLDYIWRAQYSRRVLVADSYMWHDSSHDASTSIACAKSWEPFTRTVFYACIRDSFINHSCVWCDSSLDAFMSKVYLCVNFRPAFTRTALHVCTHDLFILVPWLPHTYIMNVPSLDHVSH